MSEVAVQGTFTVTVETRKGETWREAAERAEIALGHWAEVIEAAAYGGGTEPAVKGADLTIEPDAFAGIVLVDGEAYDV